MAQINMNQMLQRIEITVTIPKTLPLRFWIAKRLISLAAWVIGTGIKVENEQPTDEAPQGR